MQIYLSNVRKQNKQVIKKRKKILSLYYSFVLFQATKALHKALSARQDLSFKGPRVQSTLSVPTERSLVKFGGLTEKRSKDQKALVHLA